MNEILSCCECLRCGYHWIPRISNPRQCPKCKNTYWNKLKKEKLTPLEPPQQKENKELLHENLKED